MVALLVAIEVAGWSAGAVRTPSSPQAWGGVRERPERVADYNLEAALDPETHAIDGRERLIWRNRSAAPIDALYIHLYLNAFESKDSTFGREWKRYGGFRFGFELKDDKDRGYIELQKVEQGGREVPWRYVHPDGGPETDHTVARLDLPRPVPPGGKTEIDFVFLSQLPRVVARTGYFGSYHLVAQWYPKVGVLELPGERGATQPRWNCHEFHLHSEFYADFGSYRAEITVPRSWIFGSTGVEIGPPREGVHRVAQDDVHDFAFTAWDGFAPPLIAGPVKVLYPPEYEQAARVTLQATLDALKYFSKTLGPYPYPQVTVVVPPYNAIESGGMEYETFFTSIGTGIDKLLPLVRFTAVHEFAHGYFMGLLASNEFEEPFLDEGLNEYQDARMLGGERGLFGLTAWDYERLGMQRFEADPIAGNSWERLTNHGYGLIYHRTALVLHDLSARLGDDVLARGFAEYYRRWKYRHPSTADFEEALADAAGPQAPLVHRTFAEQIYQTAPVDDRVTAVEAGAVEVRRFGAHVPQRVRVEFEKGAVQVLSFPESETWHRYVFERPDKVVSARLDPDREVMLDLDKLDDARTRESKPHAARRWTLEFKAWAELFFAMLGSL